MRAARFEGAGQDLRLTTIPIPVPGPDEALIAVRAVGICGSDVHIVEGHTPTAFVPITLGHEIAGVVARLPKGTPGVAVGDRVFVNPMIGCGDCASCREGADNHCPRREIIGIQRDGALAEYLVAPVANLTVIPGDVAFAEIAMIESAGTAAHAVRTLETGDGDGVVVIGAGGLGMQAVRLARLRGARVGVLDTDESARERALAAGAVFAADPGAAGASEAMRRALGSADGVDAVVDCVGAAATFELALRMLRPHGHCALVGIGAEPLSLTPPAHFMRRGLRVSAIYGYTRQDIREVAAALVDGSLDLGASVSAVVPLERVGEGIRRFAGRVGSPVRIVVEP